MHAGLMGEVTGEGVRQKVVLISSPVGGAANDVHAGLVGEGCGERVRHGHADQLPCVMLGVRSGGCMAEGRLCRAC